MGDHAYAAIMIWAAGLMADPKFETEFNLLSLYSCVAWAGSEIRDCLVGLCLLWCRYSRGGTNVHYEYFQTWCGLLVLLWL